MKRLGQLLLLLMSMGLFVPEIAAQEGEVQGHIYALPIGDAQVKVSNGRFMILSHDPHNPDTASDVVLYEAITGEVSHILVGETGFDEIWGKAVSRNGRYIAVRPGEFPDPRGVYIYDRETDQTTAIPVTQVSNNEYTQISNSIALSDNGDVAFSTLNLSEQGHAGVHIFNIHTQDILTIKSNTEANNMNISGDGRFVAFAGYNASDRRSALFLYDQDAGVKQITSANNFYYGIDIDITSDGRYIAFSTTDNTLVPNDTNDLADIFVFDQQTTSFNLVSVSTTGQQANDSTTILDLSISDDGKFIAFASSADNLVENDGNSTKDVFLHDTETGQTTLVSRTPSNHSGNDWSSLSSISGDGQYIYFSTVSNNIVKSNIHDANALLYEMPQQHVVYDRLSSSDNTLWISGHITDASGAGLSQTVVSIDDIPYTTTDHNGNYVLVGLQSRSYTVTASRDQYKSITPPLNINLVDRNITNQDIVLQFEAVYDDKLHLISSNEGHAGFPCISNQNIAYIGEEEDTRMISLFLLDLVNNQSSIIHTSKYVYCMGISSDGHKLLFLTDGDADDDTVSLFIYETQTGQTNKIFEHIETIGGMSSNGHYVTWTQENPDTIHIYDAHTNENKRELPIPDYLGSWCTAISSDARYLVYMSDEHFSKDAWVLHDLNNDQISLIIEDSDDHDIRNFEACPNLSDDGRYLLYGWSRGETGGLARYDAQTNQHQEILPPEGYIIPRSPSVLETVSNMSADGRYIVFVAQTGDIPPGKSSLFLLDTQTNSTEQIITASAEIMNPQISDDGRLITFSSAADNLVNGDSNWELDVFVYERFPQPTPDSNPEENSVAASSTSPPSSSSANETPVAISTLASPVTTSEMVVEEPFNWFPFLMGGVGLLFVGLVAGAFLFMRRSGKKTSHQPAPAPPKKQTSPQATPSHQPTPAKDALLAQGITQIKQNQLDTGIQTCRQVIKQSPDNAGAWLWLGIALAKQGNKDAAQHCFQKAQMLGHPQAAKALARLQKL